MPTLPGCGSTGVTPTACLGYSHLAPLFRKALSSFLLTTTFSLHSFLHQNRHEVPLHLRSSRRSLCLRRSRIFPLRPRSSFQPQQYLPPCKYYSSMQAPSCSCPPRIPDFAVSYWCISLRSPVPTLAKTPLRAADLRRMISQLVMGLRMN